jgi:spore germination protein GerM
MSRSNSAARTVLLGVLVAIAGLVGCAIQPDAQPRDVPEEDRGGFGGDVASGEETAGTSLIYLLAPNEPGETQLLRSAMRDSPSTSDAVVRSLLSGPNRAERGAGIETAIPADLALNNPVRNVGRVATVDVGTEIDDIDAADLRYAVAQIVLTVTALDEIDEVQIKVDGEDRVWPRGDGELTADPLTAYDFPGLVESTQPDYPAIPSVIS